jgi:transketolase
MQIKDLQAVAADIRISIIRMLNAAGSGHTGGPLGITDMLAALYFGVMQIDPKNPDYADRDRFVLSPAHMVPALYATLAERGFFPKDELITLRKFGSRLQGHTVRDLTVGVETTGGSLGQGVGIATGMALAGKLRAKLFNTREYRVYCMTSDGESQEGSVWEAAMFAAKHQLDNLTFILDNNGIQLSNSTKNVLGETNFAAKWRAFGWHVFEIDGNDMQQIIYTMNKAALVKNKPSIVISNTVAGKGVSFIERDWKWHGKVPNNDEAMTAIREIERAKNVIL